MKWLLSFALMSSLSWTNVALADPVPPETVYVDYNSGGNPDDFMAQVEEWNSKGTRVVIRGNCWSACTLYLAANNVCAFKSASFHFHAPYWYNPRTGAVRWEDDMTRQTLEFYPKDLQAWIEHRGGLGRDWLHLHGTAVFSFAPRCPEDPSILNNHLEPDPDKISEGSEGVYVARL